MNITACEQNLLHLGTRFDGFNRAPEQLQSAALLNSECIHSRHFTPREIDRPESRQGTLEFVTAALRRKWRYRPVAKLYVVVVARPPERVREQEPKCRRRSSTVPADNFQSRNRWAGLSLSGERQKYLARSSIASM